MRRSILAAAVIGGAVMAMPVALPALAQSGGGGGGSSDSSQSGGLNAATPGSPAAGNLGSTPQNMQGRSLQPAQGAATTLAPTQGRGAPDPSAVPGAMETAPGGTAVMPGDRLNRR